MKSIIKELGANLTYIIFVLLIIIFTGISHTATFETFCYVVLLSLITTLLSIVRLKYQFPNINFENEIKSGNQSAAKVASSIIVAEAIIIGLAVLALSWIYIG